jgi:hypothetical protein
MHPDLTLPGETKVAVAGDWHANPNWVGRAVPAIVQESSGIRTILHLGDFGIWSGIRGRKYLDSVDFWCARSGIERVLVTPGNHEDWASLDADFAAAPGEPIQLSPTIQVLPRGLRFTLGGRSFMSFGGAASIDYSYRTVGLDWFLTETPTDEDVAQAIAGGPVDVLLTHETVNGGTAASQKQVQSNPMGWSAEAQHYSAESREKVTRVWTAVRPEVLLHGHMHVKDERTLDDGRRVLSLGCDNQRGNLGVLNLETLGWEWLAGPLSTGRPRRTLNVEKDYLTRPDDD